MAENTEIKFFRYDNLRSRALVPNILTSVNDVWKDCLVSGYGEVPVLSASVTSGVCRVNVALGNSFNIYSVVLMSGCDQAPANGEHRVSNMGDIFFEFPTDMPDGPITGASIKAKYASAGWDSPFPSSSTRAVYRSKNTSPDSRRHYLQVSETAYDTLNVRSFHSMTDLNNGSDVYPPTSVLGNGYFWGRSYENNAVQRAWFIIASSTFLYWIVLPYNQGAWNSTALIPSVQFFGDAIRKIPSDIENVIINGGLNTGEVNNEINGGFGGGNHLGVSHLTASNAYQISGTYDGIKSPSPCAAYADISTTYASTAFSGRTAFTRRNVIDGSIEILKYKIIDRQGIERGRIPGVYFIKSSVMSDLTPFTVIDGSGDLIGRKLLVLYTNASYTTLYYYSKFDAANCYPTCVLVDITGPWE